MEFGLSDALLSEITAMARAHGLERVVLFGSRARGDYRPTSDIDLAVSGGDVDAFAVDVREETGTLLDFDIVNLDGSVQAALLHAIEGEGRIIYEKV